MGNLGQKAYPIISDGNMIVADYGATVTINEISFGGGGPEDM